MKKTKQSIINPSTLSLIAELVLDEAIYKFRNGKLMESMDSALDNKDFKLAKKIHNQIKNLNKQYSHIKLN